MNSPASVNDDRFLAHEGATSVRTYVRAAAILFLLSMVAGFFGEFYAPSSLVVSTDATATATNIVASNTLFRIGFACYLVEAMCDIGLTLIMYLLLRPVSRDLALLGAFFGLVSTATFAGAQLFYFAASFILGSADYLKTFSPDQINTLALLSLKFASYGGGIFMIFYGTASFIRGYLIYRSEFLPRFLGALLMLAGAGFVVRNFALVLAPAYASDLFLFPMFAAGLSLTAWLLIKGVDVQKWEAKARAA